MKAKKSKKDIKKKIRIKPFCYVVDLLHYAQSQPEVALQVVSEPVMQALVSVINEDTTGLQGPTAEQIAVAEKINKGEQLTKEEEEKYIIVDYFIVDLMEKKIYLYLIIPHNLGHLQHLLVVASYLTLAIFLLLL